MSQTKSINADFPIEKVEQDRFQRNNFAKGIAHIINSNSSPQSTVLGIYGEWGSGKTSLLKLIQLHLQSENIIPLYFNPWRFDSEKELLMSFFYTLADKLDSSITTNKEKVGELLKNYSGFLKPIGWFTGASADDFANSIGSKLSEVQLEELKNRIEKILLEHGKKVVIYIDDIDRLNRNEIQTIFKLVKLTGNFAYTNYVLAFDDKLVADSLAPIFGSANLKAGYDFLEKIIQTPLHLPATQDTDLINYLSELIECALETSNIDIPEEEIVRFWKLYGAFQIRLRTPRMAVRYANALSVILPMLKDDANIIDIFLIEGVRIFYPELYDLIKLHPEVFLRRRLQSVIPNHSDLNFDESKKLFNDFLASSKYNLREQAGMKDLTEGLFPMFRAMLKGSSYPESKMTPLISSRRIASPAHFNRYFSYTVLKGDIPESSLQEFRSILLKGSQDEVDSAFLKLIELTTSKYFIGKLNNIEVNLDSSSSVKLSLSMAKHAYLFSDDQKGGPFYTSPYSRAANYVFELSENVSIDERTNLYNKLTKFSNPSSFIIEILKNACPDINSDESDWILNKSDFQTIMLEAIREMIFGSTEKPFWESLSENVAWIFRFWEFTAKKGEIAKYIKQWISKEPKSVVSLLKKFSPFIYSSATPNPYRGDLTKENYDFLSRFIDPKYIYSKIVKLRTEKGVREKAEYMELDHHQTDENLIEQFIFIHRQTNKITN